MTNPSLDDRLELVVGWLPAGPGGSLASGARSLMPALLYADSVTVISPQSDDALEMMDYFDLDRALPGTVRFDSLDGAYLRLDAEGNPVLNGRGQGIYEPYAPKVFNELADTFASQASGDLAAGREEAAVLSLARLVALLDGGAYQFDVDAALRTNLPEFTQASIEKAKGMQRLVGQEVVTQWLLGAYVESAAQPRRYALLDDSAGALTSTDRGAVAERITGWAAARSVEVTLSAAFLRRLPSPNSAETWDVVADVRKRLATSLRRFRVAMADLSKAAESHPLDQDFDEYSDHIWRTRVTPALNELEELVREASFRSVFFRDVLGDLTSYAGPLIGIGTAASEALPALASAAIAAASPAVSTVAHHRASQKALRKHDFLFLHEASQRLGGH